VFIGETTQIGAVVETMDAINTEPFTISLADEGKFKRSGGDIYWVGIDKSPELVRLQKILYRSLIRHGVLTDKNDFKPHLTVSRDTVIDKNDVPEVSFTDKLSIKRISLMKCENARDGAIYTEVYAKELGCKKK
jgi:2'-5' RNA ligase